MFVPIERMLYRLFRVDDKREQRWNVYAMSLLAFSLVSFLAVYALQRFQGSLVFNPTNMPGVAPLGAFNVAVSFMTNTNWQWYSGEATMSHLTQMVGLTTQNFVSAAAGMAIVVAIIRGISLSRLADARQLLGRPHPDHVAHLDAALVLRRPAHLGGWRRAELRRSHRGDADRSCGRI